MKNENYCKINHDAKQIIAKKSFLKEASKIGSQAYNRLVALRQDYPEYKIFPREIAKKQGKKSYGQLTYKTMAEYIEAKEGKNAPTVLAEFEQIKHNSKSQSGPYAFVKMWFLTHYGDEFKTDEEAA